MSANSQAYMTKDGLAKIKKELLDLKTNRRLDVAHRIREAKELGDLSENAEYAEAKDEQGFIEGRIIEIENILKNAEIIDESSGGAGLVNIGSTVVVKIDGVQREFTIVGSNEANPANGLISNESPLGQAFLGRMKGDEVDVKVPKGVMKYEIVAVR
ncbi:MAG: transcription elongation factor GreA [Patescibacteria group bacterium]